MAALLAALAVALAAAPARAQQAPDASSDEAAPSPDAQPAQADPQASSPPAAPGPPPPGLDEHAAAAAPEGVSQMRLAEVLAVTVRHEANLARATIDMRIADAAVLEAAGIDDWGLVASGFWSSSRFAGLDQLQDSLSLNLDLNRSLSTGGSLNLHADGGFSDNIFKFSPDDPDRNYNTTLSAGFTQPLWRGRGRKYARSGQARAELNRDAASLDRERVANQVVGQIINAYWELAYAWRDLTIRRASLALAEEQLRNTRARIEAGAVAPTEALAVEQIIASREEAILNAELSIIDRSISLRQLAGLEISPTELELWALAPADISPRSFDLDALMTQAFEQNPTLLALRVRREELVLIAEVRENDTAPALDLDLQAGPTGSAGALSDAVSDTLKFQDLTFRAGLTLRHTIGQRGARGRVMSAREQIYRIDVDLGEGKAQLARDLVRAVKQAEVAQNRIALGDKVITLAEQNVAAETARFELGRATNFDVLQRQDELEQAQLQRARAVIDYLSAVTSVDALTGALLGRYGIQVDAIAEQP